MRSNFQEEKHMSVEKNLKHMEVSLELSLEERMKAKVQYLQNMEICPSCYNQEYGGIYQDFTQRLLYEDDILYCFFEEMPRAKGHTILLVKEHYNDMSYIPDYVCEHTFKVAKKMMNVLKQALSIERVYLCTMCDGKINHFHVQLIPRYEGEKIGSSNFVKQRKFYIHDEELISKIREMSKQLIMMKD